MNVEKWKQLNKELGDESDHKPKAEDRTSSGIIANMLRGSSRSSNFLGRILSGGSRSTSAVILRVTRSATLIITFILITDGEHIRVSGSINTEILKIL